MRILAVDLGDVRTGIAVCDQQELLASPVCVITERDREKLLEKIAQLASGEQVEEIVVGYPKNMDGSAGESAQKCAAFAGRLHEACSLPVKLWDERCTTMSAIGYFNVTDTRGKKRKQTIDAAAATIILQDYLDFRKNQGSMVSQ